MLSVKLFRASAASLPRGARCVPRILGFGPLQLFKPPPPLRFSALHQRTARITPLRCLPSARAFHHASSPLRARIHYSEEARRSARPLLTGAQIASFFNSPSARAIIIISSGTATVFYFTHLEEVPVSGRKRFNCFSEASAEEHGLLMYQRIIEEETNQGRIIPDWDRRVVMVKRVLARLIEAGELGSGTAGGKGGWEVHVIDDPGTANAFVLPGGKVFVYSGILPICGTDGGLAAVLAHEIAHNLAHHSAERLSSMALIQPIIWLLMYVDLYFTGTTSGLGRFLGSILLDLGIMRPASRQQESEADYIGLMLMAKSCYDPKDAVGVWEKMEQVQKNAPPEFLSTHPSNETRILSITEWLPKAETVRSDSGCSTTLGYVGDFQRAFQNIFY